MSGFLTNLVAAQEVNSTKIAPRIKNVFEGFSDNAPGLSGEPFTEQAMENDPVRSNFRNNEKVRDLDNAIQPTYGLQQNEGIITKDHDAADNNTVSHTLPYANIKENLAQQATTFSTLLPDKNIFQQKKNNTDTLLGITDQSSEKILTSSYITPFRNQYETVKSEDVFNNAILETPETPENPYQKQIPVIETNQGDALDIRILKQFLAAQQSEKNVQHNTVPSVIKINIGRIDVKAITQSAAMRETRKNTAAMSLDDFLKKKK